MMMTFRTSITTGKMMKNKMKNRVLIIAAETVAITVIRIIELLSFTPSGAVSAGWTVPALWILVIITAVTALLPCKDCRAEAKLSVKNGISAGFLGIMLAINGIAHYQSNPSERFSIYTLIVACLAGWTFVFIVGSTNILKNSKLFGKNLKGLPSLAVLWLGFALIGVFFVDKTMRLAHLNAFNILQYSACIFFLIAYLKDFCGFADASSKKNLMRFSLLSAAFALPNIVTKLLYSSIAMEGAVSMPYNFTLFGTLLDIAFLAFAVTVIIDLIKKKETSI